MRDDAMKTLVAGLGETGASVARFLHRRSKPFMVADDGLQSSACTEFTKLYPEAEVRLGDFDERFFLGADEIVLSPGVPLKAPAVQTALAAGIPVIGDIELFARTLAATEAVRRPVIAVTGSNGKSTVTTLVADMAACAGLKAAAGGNLGPPALDLIDDGERVDLYVLELSSFQLETTYSLTPEAATVLNVSQDHFDRYSSLADYAKAKQRVYRGCRTAVLNREEPYRFEIEPSSEVISFGLDAASKGRFGVVPTGDGDAIAYDAQIWLACRELGRLPGDSGVLNAQAALALGYAAGLPRAAMVEALRRFKGLPHRLQPVGTLDGATWINDSKATNVAAAVAALASVGRPCVWIAGGDGKGADFSPLCAAAGKVREAILIGRDAPAIADAVSATVRVQFAENFEDAVTRARAAAMEGDYVLLSPACSSLDMFSSYVERGDRFVRIFQELAS